MNFLKITDLAYNKLKEFLIEQSVPLNSSIRIYLANMSCHGPVFNISIDELHEDDLSQKVGDTTFIVNRNLFIQFSGFILLSPEENGMDGFTLEPVYKPEHTGCSGSCSSGCCEDCQ
ncbi:HesB-like protein [Clostridium sp. P21]|uniref:HesB-like protein n=1 Tax=Clostridium muellerianum TaxID=2716538 RepID=A0A7Y0HPQ5_9CLOT|nr:HesB-like protein [Clostridium muellerianum]NMM63962.1 HesB-like protein [Clostridium muellerianum]